jgi:hypothetical protein
MCFEKFIPNFGANFVLRFAFVTIRRSEAYEVGHRFNVPYKHVWRGQALAVCCSIYSFFMRLIRFLYAADTVMKRRRKILLTRFTFK